MSGLPLARGPCPANCLAFGKQPQCQAGSGLLSRAHYEQMARGCPNDYALRAVSGGRRRGIAGLRLAGRADVLPERAALLADLKVISVVTGHVLGVISAHDRAVKLLPKRHQLIGQLPLLFAMVAFTVGGLYLLFAA